MYCTVPDSWNVAPKSVPVTCLYVVEPPPPEVTIVALIGIVFVLDNNVPCGETTVELTDPPTLDTNTEPAIEIGRAHV